MLARTNPQTGKFRVGSGSGFGGPGGYLGPGGGIFLVVSVMLLPLLLRLPRRKPLLGPPKPQP